MSRPKTLGKLKASGYRSRSVKREIRENLIKRMKSREEVFSGIIGFERTVIPQIEHALLACHDFILLGLRGQAKTRLIRSLGMLLDDAIPVIKGCPIHSDPLRPLSAEAKKILQEHGDDTEIDWLPADQRFNEKLATPDVSVADLIGDLDPIKAMSQSLSFADEEAMHYGIIPRSNRGIFAINELPDLQPRIQVGLLNILEEKDVQIRGFPIRIPLDLLMVFTANPEDYTNRGNIITPLKDRIDAQILTHYPNTLDDAIAITRQESWVSRRDGPMVIPDYMEKIIAQIGFEARKSEYVDQNSGVSARMSISLYETLYSAIERRMIRTGERIGVARICDLYAGVPAVSGKIELVFKGEQEGLANVANYVIGKGIKEVFNLNCISHYKLGSDRKINPEPFREIIGWFENGNSLDLSSDLPRAEYLSLLRRVPGLEKKAREKLSPGNERELGPAMEFVLEGLQLHYLISKKVDQKGIRFVDSLEDMMKTETTGDGNYF